MQFDQQPADHHHHHHIFSLTAPFRPKAPPNTKAILVGTKLIWWGWLVKSIWSNLFGVICLGVTHSLNHRALFLPLDWQFSRRNKLFYRGQRINLERERPPHFWGLFTGEHRQASSLVTNQWLVLYCHTCSVSCIYTLFKLKATSFSPVNSNELEYLPNEELLFWHAHWSAAACHRKPNRQICWTGEISADSAGSYELLIFERQITFILISLCTGLFAAQTSSRHLVGDDAPANKHRPHWSARYNFDHFGPFKWYNGLNCLMFRQHYPGITRASSG